MAYTLKQKAQLYHQLFTGSKVGLPLPVLLDPALLPAGFRNTLCNSLQRLIEKGRPLSAALLFVKAITPWKARLLAAGEASGRLETALADLEGFFMARHRQLAAIQTKLLYPLVLALMLPAVCACCGMASPTTVYATSTRWRSTRLRNTASVWRRRSLPAAFCVTTRLSASSIPAKNPAP